MSTSRDLDPTTPVLVGVGQASDPVDAADYHRWSALDLASEASSLALADAGLDPALVDTVAAVRQFEISTPFSTAPLGRSSNLPRAIARRVGAAPRHAVLEVAGGQSPQHLITEFAKAIGAGGVRAVLLAGSEAISTTRALSDREDAPDFTETTDGDLDDRGYGLDGLMVHAQAEHGLINAASHYALFENARRYRRGLSRAEYAAEMGRLFAPFTDVAAANPFAAAPTRRSPAELMTVTERNRMIADPYPRFVVARDQVNQGAAVVLTSVATAREAGIPEDRWVFLHGYADLREKDLLDRPDLSTSPASVLAAQTALERAGLTVDDVDTFDLYSCFPIAVLALCDGLGLSPTDPRGLTLTGGLPFFGGAGNNYTMHAVAETVARLRAAPGSYGFVGANGGTLSKYSAAVYSTRPRPWTEWSDDDAQRRLDAVASVPLAEAPSGPGSIETYTVTYAGDGTRTGVVLGRIHDGSRFIATTVPGDDDTLEMLLGEDPFGRTVHLETVDGHTFARADRAGA